MAKEQNLDATIFHELLEADLPDREKSTARLWQEGQIIIGAGTETTAWSKHCPDMYLSIALFDLH